MENTTPVQDGAVQESMGPIVDRTREHLSASDAAIIRMRRRLIGTAKSLRDNGDRPPGVLSPEHYRAHGEHMLIGDGEDWMSVYEQMMTNMYENFIGFG